jgi:hypothetical protein
MTGLGPHINFHGCGADMWAQLVMSGEYSSSCSSIISQPKWWWVYGRAQNVVGCDYYPEIVVGLKYFNLLTCTTILHRNICLEMICLLSSPLRFVYLFLFKMLGC